MWAPALVLGQAEGPAPARVCALALEFSDAESQPKQACKFVFGPALLVFLNQSDDVSMMHRLNKFWSYRQRASCDLGLQPQAFWTGTEACAKSACFGP